MGRIKTSRVNSRRMRTARRAFGTEDSGAPLYAPGTPRWDGQHPAVAKAERAERRRLIAEGRRVLLDPVRREEVLGSLRSASEVPEAADSTGGAP